MIKYNNFTAEIGWDGTIDDTVDEIEFKNDSFVLMWTGNWHRDLCLNCKPDVSITTISTHINAESELRRMDKIIDTIEEFGIDRIKSVMEFMYDKTDFFDKVEEI